MVIANDMDFEPASPVILIIIETRIDSTRSIPKGKTDLVFRVENNSKHIKGLSDNKKVLVWGIINEINIVIPKMTSLPLPHTLLLPLFIVKLLKFNDVRLFFLLDYPPKPHLLVHL